MHDGIEIDRRGKPAAALITDVFERTALAMAQLDGIPDYPYIAIPHPLSSLDDREVRARATRLAPLVARVLLEGEGGEPGR